MSNNAIKSERQVVVSEEDDLRAQLYEFLATVLRVEPTDAVVKQVANLSGDDTPIGQASSTLAHLAQKMDGTSVRNEYVDLFIGVGRGELLPYCSYYLTGFLNEKPLAKLRQDMAAIGIARADGVKEPEDHIAALLEVMAMLVEGGDEHLQRTFFNRHLAPWCEKVSTDIKTAKSAVFYTAVGELALQFLTVEKTRFLQAD